MTAPHPSEQPVDATHPQIVARLRCPVCAQPLAAATDTRALRCPRRHSFDLARQGYVEPAHRPCPARRGHRRDGRRPSRLPGRRALRRDLVRPGRGGVIRPGRAERTDAGDRTDRDKRTGRAQTTGPTETTGPAEATGPAPAGEHAETTGAAQVGGPVEANGSADRQAEAGFGAYPLVVDAGAGTGWHLAAVLAALPDAVGLALDVAKPALRRAARAHPRAAAVLADTWQQLPLADRVGRPCCSTSSPRATAREFHRVLHPAGALLVVTPTDAHLAELVDVLGLLRVDPDQGRPGRRQPRRAVHAGAHRRAHRPAHPRPGRGGHPGRDGAERLAHRPAPARRRDRRATHAGHRDRLGTTHRLATPLTTT